MNRGLYAKLAGTKVISRGENFRPGYGIVEVQKVRKTQSENKKGLVYAVDFKVIESHDKENKRNEKANPVGSTVGFVQLPDKQQPAEGNIMMFLLAGLQLSQVETADGMVLKDEDGEILPLEHFVQLAEAVDSEEQILAGVRIAYDTRQSGTKANPDADMTFVTLKAMRNDPQEVAERRKAIGLAPIK